MATFTTKVPIGQSKRLVPLIGFGTYLIKNEDCFEPVLKALETGYRHIDTAEFYNNHEGIGRALKASGIPREEVFITDKISPDGFFGMPPRTKDGCLEGLKSNLAKLGTDYVDLILLHHPYPPAADRIEQYKALVEAQEQGLVKEIGVSNYSQKHLEQLIDAGLPMPAVNQLELHPLQTLEPLVSFCRSKGCEVMAYSSLAPCGDWRMGDNVRENSSKREEESAHNEHIPTLKNLAAKHGVPDAAIMLRWAVEKRYLFLVKSTKEERIVSNSQQPFSFQLDEEDMAALDAMNKDLAFAWPIGNPLNAE